MFYTIRFHLLILLGIAACASNAAEFRGVNAGEAGFGNARTGVMYFGYRYPPNAEFDLVKSEGFNTVRIPVKWERLQPVLFQELAQTQINELNRVVAYATSLNLNVLIDLHNYAGYSLENESGSYSTYKVGSDQVPAEALSDFWYKLALLYKDNPKVQFGLMNEPSGISVYRWGEIQQQVVTHIRTQAQASNTILLSGNLWSGAYSFNKVQVTGDQSSTNANVIGMTSDPLNNTIIELHQYMDKDSSGTSFNCVSEEIGVERITAVTNWARQHNKKLWLGEFGAGNNETCYGALDNLMQYISDNNDVWVGWTYWAHIQWFGSKYEFNIHPSTQATPKQQLQILQEYLY